MRVEKLTVQLARLSRCCADQREGGCGVPRMKIDRSRRALFVNLTLTLTSIALSLAGMEIAYRAWRAPELLLDWPNLILKHRLRGPDPAARYDPGLGFVPTPNRVSSRGNTDSAGFRLTPPLSPLARMEPPILATGDSFTFGMSVKDDESWPAYLQQDLRWRTINAGVNGYGLDQIVLRTEQLASTIHPAAAIVSFISDDVRRSEFHRIWDIEKPYFELDGTNLMLRNVPVPLAGDADALSFWQRTLGRSLLFERLWRALQHIEEEPIGYRVRALSRGTGEKLVCPLMRRLANVPTPILVVAQYDPRLWPGDSAVAREERRLALKVLHCADEAGLATLDTYDMIEGVVSKRGISAIYESTHHNPEGNRLIAAAIAAELTRRQMLPPVRVAPTPGPRDP